MSFCRYTGDYLLDHYTMLDNLFVNEYLPYADENAVKVYVYGLYLCSAPSSNDNTLESMSAVLKLSPDEIENAFRYWENLGLVQVTAKVPFDVRYIPVKTTLAPPKKFKPEKYEDFTTQLQKLYPDKMITPNEYNEYLTFIESYHVEPEAMLMIVQYCINLKGSEVRFQYVISVAKDWAQSGVKTFKDVENKIAEHEATSDKIIGILKALGKSSSGDISDREYFLKWTKNWGYEYNAVIFAANQCKKKGGMKRLDSLLDEYYRLGIFTQPEMEEYKKHKEFLYDLAKKVNKIIGVYYEALDYEVENFVNQWVQKGFDEDAILTIAEYCFKRSVRTIEGMKNAVDKFYKLGLLTTQSINNHLDNLLRDDENIARLLKTAGSERNVNNNDREFYTTWTANWGFTDEMLDLAAGLAAGKSQPFAYMNQVLARWHENKIYSPEQVKDEKPAPQKRESNASKFMKREYTREQLDAFFSNIGEGDDEV